MRLKPWLAVALVLGAGCSDDPKIELPENHGPGPDVDVLDSGVAECDQAADGRPCGQAMHCVLNVCAENVCGDGVLAGAEACDDGNDGLHDGCDAHCKLEIPVGCGNGKVEPGEECDGVKPAGSNTCTPVCTRVACGDRIVSPAEECDDGNLANGDSCSSQCLMSPPFCGNGEHNLGEQCDDGNTDDGDGCEGNCKLPPDAGSDAGAADAGGSDADAASGAADAGSNEADAGSSEADPGSSNADAGLDASVEPDAGTDAGGAHDAGVDSGSAPEPDAGGAQDAGAEHPWGLAHGQPGCAACRNTECTNFQASGFDLVAACFESPDPLFVQQCVDAMNCAYEEACGYNATGASACFCGTADLNACATPGAANGPCKPEFFAAARDNTLNGVIGAFGDLSLPLGVVFYLEECDFVSCEACTP